MKKQTQSIILYFTLSCFIVILLNGCRKDLGNYTYTQIDSLTIGNLQDTYQYSLGNAASIYPDLKFIQGSSFNESEYTYEWATYTGSTSAKKIIHTGKNLDMVLPLNIGSYRLYYVVKQKSTGITWQKRMDLEIYGTLQPGGWFILNDIAGKARLDYYQEDRNNWNTFPVTYRNLTSLIKDDATGSTLELTGRPISITAFSNKDVINSTSVYRLYINTEQETKWINISGGFIWNKALYSFANETISGEPSHVSYIYPGTSGGAYAYLNDNLYIYNTAYSLYGTPINRITGVAGTFPVSKYIASSHNVNMHALFFDTRGKRFLRSYNTSNAATTIPVSGNGLNLSDVGKDLVWMGFTSVSAGQAVAILKDGNRYYLARINFPALTASTNSINPTVASYEEITDKLTDIAHADKFALNQQYAYLFYTVGSKLYQYDMDSKIVKLAKDYGSRTISLLKTNYLDYHNPIYIPNAIQRYGVPGYGIIVASYDSQNQDTSGTVDIYRAPNLMGDLTLYTPSFTGLGKVVDVKYCEF